MPEQDGRLDEATRKRFDKIINTAAEKEKETDRRATEFGLSPNLQAALEEVRHGIPAVEESDRNN